METIIEPKNFQKLNFEGLKTLVSWAEKEGWNPGPFDAEVFWITDPDGFYGYYLNDELIAGGSIVSYNGEFGFMGFFIVKPEYRSKGIGRQLWLQRRNTLLAKLSPEAAIGMDGVLDMQAFYQKGGFEIAFRDERHEKIGEAFDVDPNISNIGEHDIENVIAYDTLRFGFARPQFIRPWLFLPDSRSFKYMENDELKGFIIIRKASVGYKVCPLFAENSHVAEELYKAGLNSVIGEPLYIDIPMCNREAVAMLKKYNTQYVFECARMYYRSQPNLNMSKVYGITTFELG